MEIAALFHHLYSEEKSAPISKLELFFTEWNRSYVVFAIVITAGVFPRPLPHVKIVSFCAILAVVFQSKHMELSLVDIIAIKDG